MRNGQFKLGKLRVTSLSKAGRLLTRPVAVSEHIGVNCILFNR